MKSNKLIVFSHLTKTGGTSLRSAFANSFVKSKTLNLKTRRNLKDIEDLKKNLSTTQLDLIMGHIPYGIHNFTSLNVKYFTMVRDPVNKIISLFNYIVNTPAHKRYYELRYTHNCDIDFFIDQYCKNQFSNQMVRFFCSENMELYRGEITEDHYLKAKKNLSNYVVGVMEYFDKSLLLYANELGLDCISYQLANKTIYRHKKYEFTSEQVERVRQANSFDILIYDEILSEFREKALNYDVEVLRYNPPRPDQLKKIAYIFLQYMYQFRSIF